MCNGKCGVKGGRTKWTGEIQNYSGHPRQWETSEKENEISAPPDCLSVNQAEIKRRPVEHGRNVARHRGESRNDTRPVSMESDGEPFLKYCI